jgi:iron(III) transport system ATP-binding protein
MSQVSPASVEFQHVVKRFGDFTAVNDVSFTIPPASLVTLLGPSGCGKTTTLRLVAGLEMASAGRILIGGKDVTRLSAAERGVSMVFQSYALFPHMNVLENAAYGPLVSGIPKAQAEAMAQEKLRLMGLHGLELRLPSELSGGQQQRVAVARALVLEPTVLLFDEPLSNLDAKLRRRVREDIRDLQQSLKLTVVYVTHDQQEALAVSDRIIVMANAVIAQEGSPRDLYERPADLFVADFIGDANLLDVEVEPLDAERATVRLGSVVLELPRRGLAAGAAKIAARPEALILSDAPPQGPALQGEIRKAAYLGTHMEYTVATPQGEVFIVDRQVGRPLPIGSSAWIGFGNGGITLVPAPPA